MTREEADPAPGSGASWRTIALVLMGLAGVATIVGLALTLASANRQRDTALQRQAHSYDVMILARSLSSTVARSEASLGRYVISSDQQLGQLYFDEWRLAETQINRLDGLTADNPDQQRRIDALRAAFQVRGDELSLIALSTRYKKNDQALARYYQARQAAALTAINRLLDTIIANERTLLDRRTAVAMASVEQSSRIASVLATVGVMLVLGGIFLGWVTVQAVSERATARAEAEAEHERAEELAVAVDEATEALRVQEAKLRQVQKMEAIGQLTGGIAHDFNNMLAVVLGGLELARRTVKADSAAGRHIASASEGADRAAALTRQLLAFSREDALKPEPIEAAALIAGMSELLDRTLGDAVTLSAQDDGSGWRVLADRVQLENAVLNLAVNARDAMDGRGEITIATGAVTLTQNEVGDSAPGEYVTIGVGDTGAGMTPEVIERVFEPFFTTKAAGKGTGLGLSQIFGLVGQLGGEIGIVSAIGVGTIVTLYLPRDTTTPMLVPASPEAAQVGEERPASLQILVVEDDPRVLAATMGALDELGHRPIACPDPLEAHRMLDGHEGTDLVISDVLMPGQTGPEMIAALPERHAHIAVLFVTGFAGDANAAGIGGRQVLRKPFTLAGLERAIGAAMNDDRPAPPEQIAAE